MNPCFNSIYLKLFLQNGSTDQTTLFHLINSILMIVFITVNYKSSVVWNVQQTIPHNRGRSTIFKRGIQHISAAGKNGKEENAKWECGGGGGWLPPPPWICHKDKIYKLWNRSSRDCGSVIATEQHTPTYFYNLIEQHYKYF